MAVQGKGNVQLHLNGVSHIITEVFYVPELKNNFLSIGQLQERGLAILMHAEMAKIYHPDRGLIIQTSMYANRMFVLLANTQEQKPACFHTSSQDVTHLWHCRYGHLSYRGLKTLQTKNMVCGLPQLAPTSVMCTVCLVGKQHRDNIPKKSAWTATEKLQLVHADIYGPVNPISNSKKRYSLCFIDDFSRKAWVYFLVEKSEALNLFKYFKTLVEKETGMYIKCLRTDRGGEFNSDEFKEFCRHSGIKRQLTTAYTPQQNGVAERKNRTVMNTVMLSEKKIPKNFWPEAVNWTVYVLNRCPTLAVKNITPEEAWSGVKPSVEHFRVFGCVAHVHVPDARRTKLEDKSFACVLLGVSEKSKGYRLYDPNGRRIVISRDVIFEEERRWNWSVDYEEQVLLDLEWGDTKSDMDEEEETDGTEGEIRDEIEEVVGSGDEVIQAIRNEQDAEIGSSNARGKRDRRTPSYLEDYTTGEGLSEEENEVNMAL